jgi:PhnB protein
MATLNTYLNFNGNTETAFNFYKSVFGGEFLAFQRFEGTPGCEDVPDEEKQGIMHVSLPIGSHSLLMGTDVVKSMEQVTFGTNMSISISPDSMAEAEHLFNGLAAGGTVQMPLQKMFWGAHFGMLVDQFGIQWMVNYDENEK